MVLIDSVKLQEGCREQDYFTMKLLSYLSELDNDPKRGILSGQDAPDVLALVRSSDRLILASRPIEVTVR